MHLRRSFAALAVTTVTALPLLASCGFAYNTDLPYTPATGTDDRSGSVDVLSAVVVSSAEGEGTFIATLSNNDQTDTATFTAVQGAEGNTVIPGDAEPVEIEPGGFVNLAEGGGVKITGEFTAGDTLPLSVGFEDGDDVTLVVPVVRACAEYAGLDPAASESADPADPADPAASPVEPTDAPETVDPSGLAEDADEAPEEDSLGDSVDSSAESDPYACTSTAEEE